MIMRALLVCVLALGTLAGCKEEEKHTSTVESDGFIAMSFAHSILSLANQRSANPKPDEEVLKSASCLVQAATGEELALLANQDTSESVGKQKFDLVLSLAKRVKISDCQN